MITLLSLFLRRTAGPGESSTQTARPGLYRLTINGLDMDATKQSVSRNGKPISLTRKEFLLLWLLASRAGEIVPRTAIASEVWGINFDSETNTVDVAIRRLRAKVDDPFEKKLIMTVRGWVIDYRRKRRRMVKLSMTLRLTISLSPYLSSPVPALAGRSITR